MKDIKVAGDLLPLPSQYVARGVQVHAFQTKDGTVVVSSALYQALVMPGSVEVTNEPVDGCWCCAFPDEPCEKHNNPVGTVDQSGCDL